MRQSEAAVADGSPSLYNVSVERETLSALDLGSDGTGFAVQLSGTIDSRWMRCYMLARVEAPNVRRFQLDPAKKIVWFACRADDHVGKIQPVLDLLCRLIAQTNDAAQAQGRPESAEGI